DPVENRSQDTNELTFDARWKATDQLTTRVVGSYDFAAERATLAGLGLEYRTACVAADLSLSRRFPSSTSVTPTTDFGLSFDLIGISGTGVSGPARRCR